MVDRFEPFGGSIDSGSVRGPGLASGYYSVSTKESPMSEDPVANVRVECGLLAAEGVWNPTLSLAKLGPGAGRRLKGSGGLPVLRSVPWVAD